MIGWITKALREMRCEHDWQRLGRGDKYSYFDIDENSERKIKTGHFEMWRCTKCGAGRNYEYPKGLGYDR